jgi:hypothetical protein
MLSDAEKFEMAWNGTPRGDDQPSLIRTVEAAATWPLRLEGLRQYASHNHPLLFSILISTLHREMKPHLEFFVSSNHDQLNLASMKTGAGIIRLSRDSFPNAITASYVMSARLISAVNKAMAASVEFGTDEHKFGEIVPTVADEEQVRSPEMWAIVRPAVENYFLENFSAGDLYLLSATAERERSIVCEQDKMGMSSHSSDFRAETKKFLEAITGCEDPITKMLLMAQFVGVQSGRKVEAVRKDFLMEYGDFIDPNPSTRKETFEAVKRSSRNHWKKYKKET